MFESFVWYLGPKGVYFVMLVPRCLGLMIFGSGSGCLGFENQAFGSGNISTTVFRRSEFLIILGSIFT